MTLEEIREMLNPNTALDTEHVNVLQGKKVSRATLSGVTLNTTTRKAELSYTLPEVTRALRQTKTEPNKPAPNAGKSR